MHESIEEYRLRLEAERCMKNTKPEDLITQEKALSELGINKTDADDTNL